MDKKNFDSKFLEKIPAENGVGRPWIGCNVCWANFGSNIKNKVTAGVGTLLFFFFSVVLVLENDIR